MGIREFVAGVLDGSIKVIGGGRSADGYFTGEVDSSRLTSADIAAEAIGNDVDGISSMPFDQVVAAVESERARIQAGKSLVDAVFAPKNRS